MRKLIKEPAIYFPLTYNLFATVTFSFVESMMEPKMKEAIEASQYEVGNYFLILGVSYATFCAISGVVLAKIKHPIILTVSSNAMMAIGILLSGPIANLGMKESITPFYMSALLIGKF